MLAFHWVLLILSFINLLENFFQNWSRACKINLQIHVVSEAFNAAKLKVGNLEKAFIEKFSIPAKILAQNSAIAASISQLPEVLEIIALEACYF